MPRSFWLALLLFIAGSAHGQDCVSLTGHSATIVLPSTVITNLISGDLVYAKHESLCVGEAIYQEGESIAVTVWGDNDMTTEVDGIPAGAVMSFAAHRPSTGITQEAIVSFENGDATYADDAFKVIQVFTLDGPLPVELTAFDALVDGTDVRLTWATASETNNAGFEVEQLMFNGDYRVLDFVQGRGTTLEAQHYAYTVNSLAPGPYRFRLKQIDYDGAFEYSPEVEVRVDVPERFYLSPPYPNPFNPQTTLTLTARNPEDILVRVFDVQGRLVQTLFSGHMATGESKELRFDADALNSGLYFVRAQSSSLEMTHKAFLVK